MTPEFNKWWDSDDIAAENPYSPETPIYWAWEGWQAARKREWQGLADEEIEDLYFDNFSMGELKAFARAIEVKLKGKNT